MNSILTFALINVLIFTGNVSMDGWRVIPLATIQYVPAFTLVPRFILSLRKLYARDLRGRRGNEIDTAFSLTSASNHGAAAASAIMFVFVSQSLQWCVLLM